MINPTLQRELFTPGHKLLAILDGAAAPDLFSKLHSHAPEHVCLYRELPPDLAETAPYLVGLKRDSQFTQWLFSQGWGKHWGIFVHIKPEIDLKQARKHFRTFSMVELPDGRSQNFRFYDPIILRDYLPACNGEETQTVFGPVFAYFVEGDATNRAIRFTLNKGLPYEETIRLD